NPATDAHARRSLPGFRPEWGRPRSSGILQGRLAIEQQVTPEGGSPEFQPMDAGAAIVVVRFGFPGHADAAMRLNGFPRGEIVGGAGAKPRGGGEGEEPVGLAGLERFERVDRAAAADLEFLVHVGQLVLYRLECPDRLPENLALLGIGNADRQAALGSSDLLPRR